MNPYRELDWLEIVKNIQSLATSGAARLSLGDMTPKSSASEALQSQQEIFDGIELLNQGIRPYMESLDLFDPWYSRIKRNAVLKTLELKDVRHFCLETLALTEAMKKISNSWGVRIQSNLMDAEKPLSAIDQLLTPRGDIRSDASETLFRLFREKENLERQVQNTLDKLVKDHQMENLLQDKYVTTREGRWVLPVRSGMKHYMPGVIHGSSQTKQTVFMEPELVIPLNNRMRQVEVEIEEEIERLLIEISNYLYGIHSQFSTTRLILEETDCLLAKAQWTVRIEGRAISFHEKEILLNEVRHPLLLLSGKPVVSNSVHLDSEKTILLLSGPNAGGKTVLLKAIGLTAQMARFGLPVCAGENSQIPFFTQVAIGIGDSQNVGEELSTFAAHLKILDSAAKLKGHSCLVLIDEICGSTDPEEGSALARSFIEQFAKNSIFGVITSHLGPLKTGWKQEDRVLNGSMEYDPQNGRPTYQYLQGVAGDSLALQTAKRVGVPTHIVERATELLSPETRIRLSGLEELENLKSDINTLKDHLKKEQQRAKFEKDKYQSLVEKFEREKDDILAKTIRQAEKKIEEQIKLAQAEQAFRKHTAMQEIKFQLPEIVKSKPGTSGVSGAESADEFAKRFPAGTKVFVASLNQDAIIQSAPNSKGDVTVLSGSLRLSLPWQDLRPAHKSNNPTQDLVRRSSAVTVAFVDADRAIDLRGMTTEEAISHLEMELDRAATQKEDRIKIIHGHGTETLKKSVRTYLSRSIYVKKWKAGSPEQGGDGVTWAELLDE